MPEICSVWLHETGSVYHVPARVVSDRREFRLMNAGARVAGRHRFYKNALERFRHACDVLARGNPMFH